jgi:acetyl esterase/lipase
MKKQIFFLMALVSSFSWKCTLAEAQSKIIKLDSVNAVLYIADHPEVEARTVVLLPGGGYNHLAKEKEGTDWVPYFTSKGISVAVVKYRLPNGDRKKPLSDVYSTFRQIHNKCTTLNLNPNGIGIMGFSAGGHLASVYANNEKGKLKPAFTILFYPVIRIDSAPYLGMARKFLGNNPTMEERKMWSSSNMVNMDTPKAFIVACDDDPIIDPSNSTIYYEALHRAHVPAVLKIYQKGGHGFGFCKFPFHDQLLQDLDTWLDDNKVPSAHAIKVACIGNSITYGARLRFRNKESYPSQLQQIMGDSYWIRNYGKSGTTMTNSSNPWTRTEAYPLMKAWQPNIIFINLGTNDVQRRYWISVDKYIQDYQNVIDTLKALPTHPRIILCLPTTSYRKDKILDTDLIKFIIPAIKKVAKNNKLDFIDLHTLTAGYPGLFIDQLHPTSEGDKVVATKLAEYLQQH